MRHGSEDNAVVMIISTTPARDIKRSGMVVGIVSEVFSMLEVGES